MAGISSDVEGDVCGNKDTRIKVAKSAFIAAGWLYGGQIVNGGAGRICLLQKVCFKILQGAALVLKAVVLLVLLATCTPMSM